MRRSDPLSSADDSLVEEHDQLLGAGRGNASEDTSQAEDLDLAGILRVLRKHMFLISAATLIGTGAAYYQTRREVPLYEAAAVIKIADARQSLMSGLGGSEPPNELLAQLEILRSRRVLREVVQEHGLQLQSRTEAFSLTALQDVVVDPQASLDTVRFAFGPRSYAAEGGGVRANAAYGADVELPGVSFSVARRPSIPTANIRVVPIDNAIGVLQGRLRVTPRGQTQVIDLAVADPDPVRAQLIANGVIRAFAQDGMYSAQQQSRRRRMFIEGQIGEAQDRFDAAQQELTEFRSREYVQSLRGKFEFQQTGMMGLDVRREELTADRRMYGALSAALDDRGAAGDALQTLVSAPGISSNAAVATLYQELTEYARQRSEAAAGEWGRASTHPEVIRLDGLIRDTRGKLTQAVRGHLAIVDARVRALDELRDRSAAEIQELPQIEAEEARLLQQVSIVREQVDELRREHQRSRMAEAVESGPVEVVDSAILPRSPLRGRKVLTLATGLLFGLMVGTGGAFLLESLNTSVRRVGDLESVLNVPALAVIPQFSNRMTFLRRSLLPAFLRNRKIPGGIESASAELIVLSVGHSPASEAYRTLRTNLIFSEAGRSLRSLVVTSTGPQEGKTTTAANLGIAYAQQGLRVLLVDCDLRKARLHQVFGVNREPGLSQILHGTQSRFVIRDTSNEGLHLLPAGPSPPNPSELIGSTQMAQLVESLAGEFDLVILDSPPLLAAADACILGTYADGVLFVIRAGSTDIGAAKHALHQMYAVGATVIGGVLNDPDSKVSPSDGFYYSEYYGADQ